MHKLTENSKNLKTNTNDSSLLFIALIYYDKSFITRIYWYLWKSRLPHSAPLVSFCSFSGVIVRDQWHEMG